MTSDNMKRVVKYDIFRYFNNFQNVVYYKSMNSMEEVEEEKKRMEMQGLAFASVKERELIIREKGRLHMEAARTFADERMEGSEDARLLGCNY